MLFEIAGSAWSWLHKRLHGLRRINPGAFVHKMPISNDRIIAVFQEVCLSALFVWAAVLICWKPQLSTALEWGGLCCSGLCSLPRLFWPWLRSSQRSVEDEQWHRRFWWDVALRSTRLGHSWEFMQHLKAALLPFLMEFFRYHLWPVSFSCVPMYLFADLPWHQLYFLCVLLAVFFWGYLLPEKQKENIFRLGLLMVWTGDSMCVPASGMHPSGVMTHPTAGLCIANYTFVALIGIWFDAESSQWRWRWFWW